MLPERDAKAAFAMRIGVLIELVQNDYPHFSLSRESMNMYYAALNQFGLDPMLASVEHFIMNRKSGERFPSIRELKAVIQPEYDPDLEAVYVANAIWGAIAKDGHTNAERARERIGELGWRVVDTLGGWSTVCEIDSDQRANCIAQWTKLVKAISSRPVQERVENQISYEGLLRLVKERE